MVRAARARNMRFEWVGVDAGYGKEPAFLRKLDDANEIFVADVHGDQHVWTERPELVVPPPPSGRGRPATKRVAQSESIPVEKFVASFSTHDWTRHVLRDGTRGEIRVDIAHRRIWLWDGEEPEPRQWHLIVRREVGSTKKIKYTLSNAPADTPVLRLAQMQGQRYWVERLLKMQRASAALPIIKR